MRESTDISQRASTKVPKFPQYPWPPRYPTLLPQTSPKIDLSGGLRGSFQATFLTPKPRKSHQMGIKVISTLLSAALSNYDLTIKMTVPVVIPDDVDDAIVRMMRRRFAMRGRDPNFETAECTGDS
jgi:hypothetical protein